MDYGIEERDKSEFVDLKKLKRLVTKSILVRLTYVNRKVVTNPGY